LTRKPSSKERHQEFLFPVLETIQNERRKREDFNVLQGGHGQFDFVENNGRLKQGEFVKKGRSVTSA